MANEHIKAVQDDGHGHQTIHFLNGDAYAVLPIAVATTAVFGPGDWRTMALIPGHTQRIGHFATKEEAEACAQAFADHVRDVLHRSRTLNEENLLRWERAYAAKAKAGGSS